MFLERYYNMLDILLNINARSTVANFCQGNTAFSYRFWNRTKLFCTHTKPFCMRTKPFVRVQNLLVLYAYEVLMWWRHIILNVIRHVSWACSHDSHSGRGRTQQRISTWGKRSHSYTIENYCECCRYTHSMRRKHGWNVCLGVIFF